VRDLTSLTSLVLRVAGTSRRPWLEQHGHNINDVDLKAVSTLVGKGRGTGTVHTQLRGVPMGCDSQCEHGGV